MPSWLHVFTVHCGGPHLLGPAAPHDCPIGQLPQSMTPPQPSPAGPQSNPSCATVCVVHVGMSGVTQDDRSNSMNSSSFSCGVIAPAGHSAGNVLPPLAAAFSTWKSENTTRPH